MTSLHTEAMAWLRYGKRMPLVCTEAGYWNADVLGIDDQKCIEVEVKKSRADFLADFRNKVRKHETYARLDQDGRAVWSPNYYYIFVPAALGKDCLEALQDLHVEHAGLAVLDRESVRAYGAGRNVSILKRAPRLHGNKPHPKLVRSIQLRMGSELTSLRLAWENAKKAAPEQMSAMIQEAVALSKSLAGRPDWESDDGETAADQLES